MAYLGASAIGCDISGCVRAGGRHRGLLIATLQNWDLTDRATGTPRPRGSGEVRQNDRVLAT